MWLLGSVIRTIDYPNYRWSQLVRIIDVLLYCVCPETSTTDKWRFVKWGRVSSTHLPSTTSAQRRPTWPTVTENSSIKKSAFSQDCRRRSLSDPVGGLDATFWTALYRTNHRTYIHGCRPWGQPAEKPDSSSGKRARCSRWEFWTVTTGRILRVWVRTAQIWGRHITAITLRSTGQQQQTSGHLPTVLRPATYRSLIKWKIYIFISNLSNRRALRKSGHNLECIT